MPDPIKLEPVMEKYPVKYEESMNTVLIQEVQSTCTVYCTCTRQIDQINIRPKTMGYSTGYFVKNDYRRKFSIFIIFSDTYTCSYVVYQV